MADISDAIFREYDIRGVFGEDLTVEVAELLGRGYAVYLDQLGVTRGADFKVTVGRDVRLSSKQLRDALIKGLTGSGINCVDIGECPTPLQYYSMHTLPVGGGVMITGSHNPPEYNGFKVSVGKETIHGEEIQRMKHIIREHVIGKDYPQVTPGTVETEDVVPGYIDYVAANIEMPRLERPLKVVLDSGNGTAGPVAVPLVRKLGCDVVELFSEPDGAFPNHHPDPTVAKNLQHLIDAVLENEADFGVAYDGDADRIGVVDEKGGIIWGDKLMIVYSRSILETNPGATIVGEVKCSQVMYDEIARWGGVPVMWKTGHSLIKARMKELGAAMAGEMSGHIFFADRWFGFDDAVYASARLMEIVAQKLSTDAAFHLSSMFSGLPETVVTPEIRIDCPDDIKFSVIEKLEEAIGSGSDDFKINDVIKIDGLRVNFDGGWALVRASNTQPVLVLRFEATDNQLLEKAKFFMKTRIEQVRPGIVLGF
ncbi:MAG: phosphomannomutase/phosphoglucomutase [Thermodesulfobacteriota bacterium]|nr:MAG: phosphomannomutase/phosphoglucomutase [Thermodesulfobacteriota bacterium]